MQRLSRQELIRDGELSSEFVQLRDLGKGSYGRAFLAHWLTRGHDERVAIKQIDFKKLRKHEQVRSRQEAQLLASLRHPNIIKFKDAFFSISKRCLFIVMEYATGGRFFQTISRPERTTVLSGQNITAVLHVCHAKEGCCPCAGDLASRIKARNKPFPQQLINQW